MFKKPFCIAAMILSSGIAIAAQQDPASQTHHFGAIELKDVSFKDGLHHSGMLRLVNAKVATNAIVNGIVDAENSQLGDLTINGSGTLSDVTIAGPTTINGQIDAKNTKFEDAVTVYGYLNAQTSSFKKLVTIEGVNTNFTDCTLQDVFIKNSEPNLVQHLNLKGTKINGTVTFDSGKGIIVTDANSKISGEVKGATVQGPQGTAPAATTAPAPKP